MFNARRRLLIVDDDRDFAESLGDLLQLLGYEVELAYSGHAAIERCGEVDFDLVLMDVRMPGKDGVQSFMEIRAANPDFRVILMTANPGRDLREKAETSGARAVVGKPLAPDLLVELIEQHRQRCLILVVDDDEDFADSLATNLEQAGYAVSLAADGESALHSAATVRPKAIVLDLRLPGSSGLEVFLELKRRELQAPTVVVSAWINEEGEAISRLREGAVAAVLGKPFAPDALLSVLATIPRGAPTPPRQH